MARTLPVRVIFAGVLAAACGAATTRTPGDSSAARDTVAATRRLPLDSGGSWDHVVVGASPHRLYVAHETHVDVVDLDRDTLVGVIRETPDVHGVVLAPDLGRGYASNGGDSTLGVFDPRTLAISRRIHLRADAPDGVAYDPATHRVFAMHANAPSLSVVQAGPDSLVGSVGLGGSPDGGVADGRGTLFVALKDRSEIVLLDTRRLAIVRRSPLAPCIGPDAIAIDTTRGTLWLGCDNGMAVAQSLATGVVTSSFPIGAGVDGIIATDDGRVLVSTGVGQVTVARTDAAGRYRVVDSVRTRRGSRTSAWDPPRGRLLVPAATLTSDARMDSIGRDARAVRTDFGVLVLTWTSPARE